MIDDASKTKRQEHHLIDLKSREMKLKRKMIDRLIKLRQLTAAILGNEPDARFATNKATKQNAMSGMGGFDRYKILFVDKLPKSVTYEQLCDIFMPYEAMEVRPVPEKGVCFVEFMNDEQAEFALQSVKEANVLQFSSDEGHGAMVAARINFAKK